MVIKELMGYLGGMGLGVWLELKGTQDVLVILARKDAEVS